MEIEEEKLKLLALSLYEIRLLLSDYIGPASEDNVCVAAAANLAYSLHNEALAIIEDRPDGFDVSEVVGKIRKIEKMLGDTYSSDMQQLIEKIET